MSQKYYDIGNLDCANCAKELETGIGKLDAVNFAQVDFANMRLVIEGEASFEQLQQRAQAFGNTLHDNADPTATPADEQTTRGGVLGFWDYLLSRNDTRMALIGFVLILLGLLVTFSPLPLVVSSGIYTVALAIAVYPIATSGVTALRINRRFTIDLLMSLAGVGALIIGEYLEATTVVFLYVIGEALEGYVTNGARQSLKTLMDLKPTQAIRMQDGVETTVHVDQLNIGDVILVKPGERIPMDGIVQTGHSGVNQAPITGESIPVDKHIGDDVFAASINENGTLQVEVTRRADDNTLSRIIDMVTEAQSQRAPSQRMIDEFASYYTPAVMVVALLVAIGPPLVFGAPFIGADPHAGWFYRALTILVIACPCALVISTPVTVISAITAAARRGVLIKGGAHLEALGTVRAIAFDKTGTLTRGEPQVMDVHAHDCDEAGTICTTCDDVLALASAVEKHNTHPLAQAVVNTAAERELLDRYPTAQDVEVLAGAGVRGVVNGREVVVGSHAYFDQHYTHSAELCARVKAAEQQGYTTMMLHDGDDVRGYIAVADAVRETSPQVIVALNALNLTTVMLTGDNATVARAVGEHIKVSDVRAELLPQDKVTAVQDLRDTYGRVAMIGDGVNDTPALATATVGVAMGGAGTAQAMETADIALMADDLAQLPYAVRLARFARRLIMQNVGMSIAMKLIFLLLAIGGGVTMWAAIFADVGMSLIVTLNGMRPLRR